MNAGYDIVPDARFILPKQAGRSGTMGYRCHRAASASPARMATAPRPACRRASQLSDTGIHRNHEVQTRYQRAVCDRAAIACPPPGTTLP
jgi:hypothetical protein